MSKDAKNEFVIDPSRVDWDQLGKLGVSKEMLEKNKCLEKMLGWQKSPMLVPIVVKLDDHLMVRTEARLGFREVDGKLTAMVYAVRKEPNLERPLYGAVLTDEDKRQLRETGNAGRLIEIEPVKGDKRLAFVSVDRLTNDLVVVKADRVRIPEDLKGVRLSADQQSELANGKAVFVEGMVAKSGKVFDAFVQVNAEKRGIEFRFEDRVLEKAVKVHDKVVKVHDKLLGVSLTEGQQQDLKDGKRVLVKGLKDANGKVFDAQVQVNGEKNKLDFFREKKVDVVEKVTEKVTSDFKLSTVKFALYK